MKKILALLLAIVMVIGMAACNQTADPTDPPETKGTEAPKATDAPETTEAAVDPKALPLCEPMSEKLIIGMQSNATVLDYHDNYLTKYLEEKTGIDIDFMFFSADTAEAKQQLNLMIAGNEKLPDIIKGILDDTLRAELGGDGYLLDLKPYFESEKWVWGKDMLENSATDLEKALWWALGASPDGGMYTYPGLGDGGAVDLCGYLGGINKNWASKLGMNWEDIDTVAEVKEYLQKALSSDPNGNGKADEVGLIYRQKGYRGNAELWLLNAWVKIDDAAIFNVDDGELWAPQITDEYREALIELNAWYKEGLISSLAYTIADNAEHKALIETPDCYTVAAFAGHPEVICNGDSQIGDEYGYIQPLAAETDKGGYGLFGNNISISKTASITTDCENPDLAFRFLDWIYGAGSDVAAVGRYGEEGVNWEYINGEVEIDGVMTKVYDKDGYPAGFRELKDEWSTETKATWHSGWNTISGSLAIPNGVYFAAPYGYLPVLYRAGSNLEIAYNCRFAQNEAKHAEEKFYGVVYNAEETEVKNTYQKLLKDYILQARAEFITGVKDPSNDADWDAYLKEMEANGLTELMEASQEAYTRTIGSALNG